MTDLFWNEVRKAVTQVSTHRNRQIEIERGDMKATVVAASKTILISIEEITSEPPTLVVPS